MGQAPSSLYMEKYKIARLDTFTAVECLCSVTISVLAKACFHYIRTFFHHSILPNLLWLFVRFISKLFHYWISPIFWDCRHFIVCYAIFTILRRPSELRSYILILISCTNVSFSFWSTVLPQSSTKWNISPPSTQLWNNQLTTFYEPKFSEIQQTFIFFSYKYVQYVSSFSKSSQRCVSKHNSKLL